MKNSLRLTSAFGIGIFVHWSFGLLLAWVAFAFLSAGAGIAGAVQGIFLVLCVFGCVVLHELGHSLAARRYGIGTRHITLLPIGGVAQLERMPRDPKQELVIAIAGPLVNVGIVGVLGTLSVLFNLGAGVTGFNLGGTGLGALISNLIFVNVILVIFNLIPAFPMDGGRVLRALLSMKHGHLRATQTAAGIGKFLAFGLGIGGLVFLQNPILILTGLFVWFGAEAERRAAIEQAYYDWTPPTEPPTVSSDPVWEVIPPKSTGSRTVRFRWR